MRLGRKEVEKLIDFIRLSLLQNDEIASFIEIDEEITGSDLVYGVSNGYLSSFIETITGVSVEVEGHVEELLECPCCGYKTLTEIYDISKGTGYDICQYCGWEDDGTSDVNLYKSINKGSIMDYRKRIKNNKEKYINKWL